MPCPSDVAPYFAAMGRAKSSASSSISAGPSLSLPYHEWLVVGPDPVVDTPSVGHHRAGQGDLMDNVRRPDRQRMSRLKAPFQGKIHRADHLLCKVCDPRDARVRGSQNEPCALTIAFTLGEYGESAARRR